LLQCGNIRSGGASGALQRARIGFRRRKEVPVKTLILVRHAKSDWDDSSLADSERPLAKRGRRDAPRMAQRLLARGLPPERILSSPVRRAYDTACLFATGLGIETDAIETIDRLYAADAATWLEIAGRLPAQLASVLIVGHNPEITEVAGRLCPAPIENMPTCAVLRLQYATADWREIAGLRPVHWDFDYPKRLPGR
jgi:phosphohistidine phosphatase